MGGVGSPIHKKDLPFASCWAGMCSSAHPPLTMGNGLDAIEHARVLPP